MSYSIYEPPLKCHFLVFKRHIYIFAISDIVNKGESLKEQLFYFRLAFTCFQNYTNFHQKFSGKLNLKIAENTKYFACQNLFL